jgi:outer membrane protein
MDFKFAYLKSVEQPIQLGKVLKHLVADHAANRIQFFILSGFVISLLLLIAPVRAENLLDVYSLAISNDPSLQAKHQEKLATDELKSQAGADFMPKINAYKTILQKQQKGQNSPFPKENIHYNTQTFSLKLTQPIFYFQEWVKFSQASHRVCAATASYAAAELDLITRTFEVFFGVLKARDALYLAQAQRKAYEKFTEQTEQRYQAGLIPSTDFQIAKAKRDGALSQEIAARTELENRKEKLKEVTGCSIERFASLRTDLKFMQPEPADIEKWVLTALDQNLSLQAARSAVAASKNDIKIQQGGHLPNLNLVSELDHIASYPNTPKETSSYIGLEISLPIFSGGSINSKTRQAMHLFEKTNKEYETLYRQVESVTRQSYRNVLTQISQVTALKQAVHSNQSALEATEASFAVGTRTISDVLNAQSDLIKAQLDYANARYDYILQSIKLKQAAGTLSPEDVSMINNWLEPEKI